MPEFEKPLQELQKNVNELIVRSQNVKINITREAHALK
jgi:hypothetical protein